MKKNILIVAASLLMFVGFLLALEIGLEKDSQMKLPGPPEYVKDSPEAKFYRMYSSDPEFRRQYNEVNKRRLDR